MNNEDIEEKNGYNATAKKYFVGGKSIKSRLYWLIPPIFRNLLRKIRG